MERLLAVPREQRRIVVYSEDIASYNQLEGYLNAIVEKYEYPIVYVTSAPDDPLLADHHGSMSVFYVNRLVASLFPRIDSEICITTMPDLSKFHIRRPKKECCCLYIFHSLNSIHEVYREGAFDHYDAFFCTGPHHKRELETHFKIHGLPMPSLYEVGYYKLDRVAEAYRFYTKQCPDKKTVLIAPSWGKGNLLETAGDEIVGRLLALGVRVIVRPHPCFFLPIYPNGAEIVENIARQFESHPEVVIERDIRSEDSFYEADLMICDFSGAAFEYALGTLRPVLFVDVARKTMNPNWKKLDLPTFEDVVRRQVGQVISPEEIRKLDEHATAMLSNQKQYADHLKNLRQELIYNFGESSRIGAQVVDDILGKGSICPAST